MLGKVTYIALFVLAVEATITVTPWSGLDIDLLHEFANVLAPRDVTDLQVCFSASHWSNRQLESYYKAYANSQTTEADNFSQ